jgi:predicted secreted Zn-dependent protease
MVSMRSAAALVLTAAALAVPRSAMAQTVAAAPADPFAGLQNVSFEYYDVPGTDEESINDALNRNGPPRPDGDTASGATRYTTRIQPFNQPDGKGGCTVTKVRYQLGAVVILPRLTQESAVPERIMVKWRPFMAGLRRHEAGHVRIHYQHVPQIEAALIGVRCDAFPARVTAELDRLSALQKAYDRETRDGGTQGALLQ